MATKKKLLQAAAGAAGGAGLDIPEVFSTYVYDGDGSTSKTITNGIDLSGEGGMVWIKRRDSAIDHHVWDTERGVQKRIRPNTTDAEVTQSNSLTAFNSNGFTVSSGGVVNSNGNPHVAWTFRKAPKFFDVQTWTGNGTAGRTISHDLGSDPGMVIIKRTDSTQNWIVHHRSLTATKYLALNLTNGEINGSDVTATSSTNITLSDSFTVNGSSATYVGYFFAHNDGDGEFGPDGDADIIKCGSYTGASTPNEINVGFEPQFVMIKRTSGSGDWMMFDAMRGVVSGAYPNLDNTLFANLTNAERTNTGYIGFTPTGFEHQGGSGDTNTSGQTYIYMAIRRGPLAEPENATDVFGISDRDAGSGDGPITGFVTDFSLLKNPTSGSGFWYASSRLTGGFFTKTNGTDAEASNSSLVWDRMDGVWTSALGSSFTLWGWKRAPSFCDVVAYTGTGSNRTVSHNLGAVPEMMWIKRRDTTGSWAVFHKDLNTTSGEKLNLNSSSAASTNTSFFNSTVPTSSVFTVGTSNNTNASSGTYIAYLFASLDGVSKVGSYTGNASTQNIDCGFASGASFVLIKRTDDVSNWFVYDTERGIVSGNDPFLNLDNTDAENSSNDYIDPYSSGFAVTNSLLNESGGTYIFYAIA